jgi:hypothetical protein
LGEKKKEHGCDGCQFVASAISHAGSRTSGFLESTALAKLQDAEKSLLVDRALRRAMSCNRGLPLIICHRAPPSAMQMADSPANYGFGGAGGAGGFGAAWVAGRFTMTRAAK